MRKLLGRIKSNRANSLVEVIVSMLIISISGALLASGVMTALNFFMRGNDILHSLAAAENNMEYRIADGSGDEMRTIEITYENSSGSGTLEADMLVIAEPLGIDANLYYYLY